MKNNKIKLTLVESLLEKKDLLTQSDIRRLGGRRKNDKVSPVFKCTDDKSPLYITSGELKKLLCFISCWESFPKLTLEEISKKFNDLLKDSSIDEFMKITFKEKNKRNDKLLNMLINIGPNNSRLENDLKKYIDILASENESIKNILLEQGEENIYEFMFNSINEEILKNKHEEFFLNYDKKIFKYLEVSNINNSIYSIIENIQKNKFSKNKDLNSKLLSPYKETFVKLEKFILNQKFNTSTIQVECKSILDNFISSIKQELTKRFEEIKVLKLKLDYKKIINDIKPIENKLERLIDYDRFNKKKEGNLFNVPKNEKEDIFNCFDELIAFYSSENGRLLDEIFKNNQIILKLFNLLISNDFLQEGKHVFLKEFKVDEIYSLEEDFKSIRLENTIFYPGYNFYFNEHLINDIYIVLGSKDSNEQDRLISYAEKIIPYIKVGLDSDLSKVYENAIYSKNPRALEILKLGLNNLSPNDLRIVTEAKYSDEIIINSIDLLGNIDLKGYYKHIYNGNYKIIKSLYEENINTLREEDYILEMNFCLEGKKPVEMSRVIFEEARKNHSDYKKFKIRFCNVAAVLNNNKVLEDNLEFLKEQSSKSEEINELLAHCLNNGMKDLFSKIYNHKQFDMYKIFMRFYTLSPNVTKDPKTWEFIINNIFKELDVNKEINRKIDFTSLGLDEKNIPSGLNNLESPIENESSIALYVAYNFFPKGIKNFNFCTFGKYNLTFLDKLRKESEYYKQEFEAIYEILTSKREFPKEAKELKDGDTFEILYIAKNKEEFAIICKVIENCQDFEILLLKTSRHKNVDGGLKVINSINEAKKMMSEITLKNNTECLLAAIKNKDIKKVKSILNGIIDINREDQNGMSPLIGACVLGSTDITELLLLNKANPNKIINSGKFKGIFPLMLVAESNNLNIVKLLIKNNADVNLKYNNGCTSLMQASEHGHEDIVKILIENGADINLKKDDGVTALELASELGHEKIVNLLIKKDANINVQTNEGFTPLMMAAQMGKEKVTKLLLDKGADFNIKSNQGITALLSATISGSQKIMEDLLKKGANINVRASNGYTALLLASELGHDGIIKLLLEKGVDINIKTNEGITSLMIAAHMSHSKVVKLLLEKGCSVDNNGYGWTPSAMDTINKSPELSSLFLKNLKN